MLLYQIRVVLIRLRHIHCLSYYRDVLLSYIHMVVVNDVCRLLWLETWLLLVIRGSTVMVAAFTFLRLSDRRELFLFWHFHRVFRWGHT